MLETTSHKSRRGATLKVQLYFHTLRTLHFYHSLIDLTIAVLICFHIPLPWPEILLPCTWELHRKSSYTSASINYSSFRSTPNQNQTSEIEPLSQSFLSTTYISLHFICTKHTYGVNNKWIIQRLINKSMINIKCIFTGSKKFNI